MLSLTLIKDILRITSADITRYGKAYIDNGLYLGIGLVLLYILIKLICMKSQKPVKVSGTYVFLKSVIIILTAVYIYVVVGITILSRTRGSTHVLDLQLFTTFSWKLSAMVFIVENIIMFIPLGILLPMLWPPLSRFYFCIPLGFIGSFLIECAQYRLKCGKFQVDDLLTNMCGTLIGFIIYKISTILFYKIQMKKKI